MAQKQTSEILAIIVYIRDELQPRHKDAPNICWNASGTVAINLDD